MGIAVVLCNRAICINSTDVRFQSIDFSMLVHARIEKELGGYVHFRDGITHSSPLQFFGLMCVMSISIVYGRPFPCGIYVRFIGSKGAKQIDFYNSHRLIEDYSQCVYDFVK